MQKELENQNQGGRVYLLLMLLMVFAGLAGLAALASWALGRITRHSHRSSQAKDEALEVLKKRYVRGKIDREQFDLM